MTEQWAWRSRDEEADLPDLIAISDTYPAVHDEEGAPPTVTIVTWDSEEVPE